MANLVDLVKEAGVVGAGGAGFPTYVKLDAEVEWIIINGAECEPLLYKDKELLKLFPDEVIGGLRVAMDHMKAKRGTIAFKDKKANEKAKEIYFQRVRREPGIDVFLLGDYYPSGDEILLVYDVTGRLIPAGSIPLSVGVANSNVETFINIYRASKGEPVTETWISICGDVEEPFTCKVPVGTRVGDLLDATTKILTDKPALMTGGIMMGRYVQDGFDDIITKTCAGYVILPEDHYLIRRKTAPRVQYDRIGKSACDQCSYCTEFCPRYLVGHHIEPHRVMRSLGMTGSGYAIETEFAAACIECGLCGLYACPEELSPNTISGDAKRELFKKGYRYEPSQSKDHVHPMYHYRKTPIERLIHKLGLVPYDKPAYYKEIDFQPETVRVPLKQHIGVPSEPVVKKGNKVKKGQVIGNPPDGKMGSTIHASIDGEVRDVTPEWIEIKG